MTTDNGGNAPAIAVLATLDTKGHEAAFLAERIRAQGHPAVLFDLGVAGEPAVPAEVTRTAIAEAAGLSLANIHAMPRVEALETVAQAARTILVPAVAEGKIIGLVGVGGGSGTWLCNAIMRDFPIGFPKLVVSTAATHDASVDITIMPSIADVAGLNRVLTPVLANAAAAICGMVEKPAFTQGLSRPAVALTMYGLTTKGATYARHMLEDEGFEVVVFHSNGAGGGTMERLVDAGIFDAVLDWSTTEVTDEIVGGVCSAGPQRLEAAGRRGIPQVIVPGGIDSINFLGDVPERMKGRVVHMHLPGIPLVRASADELAEVGAWIARKLNRASGPIVVVVPERGFSAHDAKGGVFEDRDADAAFVASLTRDLRAEIPIVPVPEHINTPEFARVAVDALLGLLRPVNAEKDSSP
jgi:uncharacterized protein (UPF0261 family)